MAGRSAFSHRTSKSTSAGALPSVTPVGFTPNGITMKQMGRSLSGGMVCSPSGRSRSVGWLDWASGLLLGPFVELAQRRVDRLFRLLHALGSFEPLAVLDRQLLVDRSDINLQRVGAAFRDRLANQAQLGRQHFQPFERMLVAL